jgi:hypothetical protein
MGNLFTARLLRLIDRLLFLVRSGQLTKAEVEVGLLPLTAILWKKSSRSPTQRFQRVERPPFTCIRYLARSVSCSIAAGYL